MIRFLKRFPSDEDRKAKERERQRKEAKKEGRKKFVELFELLFA